MACSFWHERAFNPSLSRIRVNDLYDQQFYLPLTCVHCADMPCGVVCPTAAIRREADGQVRVYEERCIGCKMCLLACPFGVMGFAPQRGVAQNCDLCGGDPQCVKFCVPQALEFAEVETAAVAKQKMYAAAVRPSLATPAAS
jgi:Fe-S-cluster-containing hydrogenase component 2